MGNHIWCGLPNNAITSSLEKTESHLTKLSYLSESIPYLGNFGAYYLKCAYKRITNCALANIFHCCDWYCWSDFI